MWMLHPGACSTEAQVSKAESKATHEKRDKGAKKERMETAESSSEAAARQLIALLACIGEIPADMLTIQCKQVTLNPKP